MADAEDSKSSVGNHVRVQVPLSAPTQRRVSTVRCDLQTSRFSPIVPFLCHFSRVELFGSYGFRPFPASNQLNPP
jgi:hypothetical protein